MKKILVIEDDKKIAHSLKVRLTAAGYDVQTASNGVDGLRAAQDIKPDLAILDMFLPLGAGESVAYRLRQHSPDTPFIFLTARKDEAARKAAEQLSAAAFFEKPYDAAALLEGIEKILKNQGPSRPIKLMPPPVETAATPIPTAGQPKKKLLIIEDDQKIAAALAIRVKAAGYHAVIAHDAVLGMASAVKERPDLVLLDISMPAGNGFAVAEQIQTVIPVAIPIIFLTASKEPEFRQRASDLGAAAFFEKPYDSEKLLATIHRCLN